MRKFAYIKKKSYFCMIFCFIEYDATGIISHQATFRHHWSKSLAEPRYRGCRAGSADGFECAHHR